MRVVICNPADVNLADVKALAAKYDTNAVGNPYVPSGQALIANLPDSPSLLLDQTGGEQ